MTTYSKILTLLLFIVSNTVFGQLPWSEDFSGYATPSGVQGAGINIVGDYPALTPWVIDATSAALTATSDYGYVSGGVFQVQDSDGDLFWTTEDIDITGCTNVSFSIDLSQTGTMEATDYIHVEYSTDGGATYTSINNWSGLGDASHTVIDDFVSTTVTQSGLSGTTFKLRVTFNCNAGTEQLNIDNISVTGNCTGPITITTGAVSGSPFTVDCDVPTTDIGTVSFTTTGTFSAGNTFTAQLSDASGSFATPIDIGTLSLSGVDPSGVINITIPAGMASGSGYLIRIISDNPGGIGSNSASFTITQTGACAPSLPSSQGLLINEWSNGPSGSQEYYEFVVAGQCGDLVDIRGYILDDNNGTFSATFPSSSGIAPGHLRLTNNAQWASIPVGSLIVVYNDDEPNPSLPPDDINDSDNDSLYVIPHNEASLFEITTDLPDNNISDSTYTPVTYASVSWSPLGLRNAGDAIQVRDPSGAYWHGVSYGGAEITGGPNNMKIASTGMGGNCGWFTDGDYLSTANWTTGAVTGNETPGYENNALNLAWLRAMRDPLAPDCPITVLPVEIGYFDGENHDEGNVLYWNTASEKNSDYFTIEKSLDGKHWEEIGTVKGAGNSEYEITYQYIDFDFRKTINYYRLKQTDFDGVTKKHFRIVTINNGDKEGVELIGVYNLMGQEVDKNFKGVQIRRYSDGSTEKIFNE